MSGTLDSFRGENAPHDTPTDPQVLKMDGNISATSTDRFVFSEPRSTYQSPYSTSPSSHQRTYQSIAPVNYGLDRGWQGTAQPTVFPYQSQYQSPYPTTASANDTSGGCQANIPHQLGVAEHGQMLTSSPGSLQHTQVQPKRRGRRSGLLKNPTAVDPDPTKYRCKVPNCNESCHTKSALEAHKRLHANNEPHKCSICGVWFPTRGVRDGHRRKHGQTPKKFQAAIVKKVGTEWGYIHIKESGTEHVYEAMVTKLAGFETMQVGDDVSFEKSTHEHGVVIATKVELA